VLASDAAAHQRWHDSRWHSKSLKQVVAEVRKAVAREELHRRRK
jgi:hypothetical protein